MQVEGIHIKGYVKLDDALLMKSNILEDFALRCIERGKELALEEHKERNTILWGKELSDFLKMSYDWLKKWRRKPHPKYGEIKFTDNAKRIEMTLADAKQLRNQILGL